MSDGDKENERKRSGGEEEREESCLNYCGLVLCVKPQWEEMKHVPEMYGCLIIKATVKLVPRCSTHNDQQAPFLQEKLWLKKV